MRPPRGGAALQVGDPTGAVGALADPNLGAPASNDGRPSACQEPLPIANNKAGPWL